MTVKQPVEAPKKSTIPPTQTRGERFHDTVIKGFELTESELELLETVCKILDEIELLQLAVDADGMTVTGAAGQVRIHPGVSQLLQHRLALGRLLSQLHLPNEDGESLATPTQARGRIGAKARWANG